MIWCSVNGVMLIDRNSGYTEARPDTILPYEKITTNGGKLTTEKAEPGEKKAPRKQKTCGKDRRGKSYTRGGNQYPLSDLTHPTMTRTTKDRNVNTGPLTHLFIHTAY